MMAGAAWAPLHPFHVSGYLVGGVVIVALWVLCLWWIIRNRNQR